MSFCLLADESLLEDGIKLIAVEEMGQAIKEIDNPRLKRSEARISSKTRGFAIRRRDSPSCATPKP